MHVSCQLFLLTLILLMTRSRVLGGGCRNDQLQVLLAVDELLIPDSIFSNPEVQRRRALHKVFPGPELVASAPVRPTGITIRWKYASQTSCLIVCLRSCLIVCLGNLRNSSILNPKPCNSCFLTLFGYLMVGVLEASQHGDAVLTNKVRR